MERVKEMPKSENREYRSMAVLAVARDAAGAGDGQAEEKSYRVRGYATTFDEPYVLWEDFDGTKYYEQVARKAFDEADMSDVIMQYDHAGMVFARNRNGSLKLTVDDHGLLVEADLSLTLDSRKLYLQLGEEKTAELFVRLAPGEHPDFPDGHDDKTHFNAYGAKQIAGLVAQELKQIPECALYLKA
jgi:hypothetical protein